MVRDTIQSLAPGAAGDILTDALRQGSTAAGRESGETALIGGAVAASVAGTTAMAQVERGANRIYGVERDRPFVAKYLRALLLALTAGILAMLSLILLVGGAAIRDSVSWSEAIDTVWQIARWPLGLIFSVASVALLFEYSPRRRQPEASWLAVGAGVAAASGSCSWGCSTCSWRPPTRSAPPTGPSPARSECCSGPSSPPWPSSWAWRSAPSSRRCGRVCRAPASEARRA